MKYSLTSESFSKCTWIWTDRQQMCTLCMWEITARWDCCQIYQQGFRNGWCRSRKKVWIFAIVRAFKKGYDRIRKLSKSLRLLWAVTTISLLLSPFFPNYLRQSGLKAGNSGNNFRERFSDMIWGHLRGQGAFSHVPVLLRELNGFAGPVYQVWLIQLQTHVMIPSPDRSLDNAMLVWFALDLYKSGSLGCPDLTELHITGNQA